MLCEPFFSGVECAKIEMWHGVEDTFCAFGFECSFLAAVFALVKRSYESAYAVGNSFHIANLRNFFSAFELFLLFLWIP